MATERSTSSPRSSASEAPPTYARLTQEKNWPNVHLLPFYFEFEKRDPVPFRALIPDISDEGVDLLEAMLDLNPNKRISVSEALKHPFFLKAQGEKNYTKKLAEMDVVEKFKTSKK